METKQISFKDLIAWAAQKKLPWFLMVNQHEFSEGKFYIYFNCKIPKSIAEQYMKNASQNFGYYGIAFCKTNTLNDEMIFDVAYKIGSIDCIGCYIFQTEKEKNQDLLRKALGL